MGAQMVINNITKNRLVTLRAGRYWKVDPHGGMRDLGQRFDLKKPTPALLLEFQGNHSDQSECWHALVFGKVILVWETDFNNEDSNRV
jgi:hypothetical protein